jgi:hypothetical protein
MRANFGLRISDCGLRIADCGLKMEKLSVVRCQLSVAGDTAAAPGLSCHFQSAIRNRPALGRLTAAATPFPQLRTTD